jgi:two-component system sensor histidine kinase QseC
VPTSIRKFLLINLLLAITITTTLTAIGNYYLDEKDIHEHLDIIMAVSALSYQALLGDDLNQRNMASIQKKLNNIPQEIHHYFKRSFLNQDSPAHYLSKFSFQILSPDGDVLLQSQAAPKSPLSAPKDGFKDKVVDGNKWRIFTAKNHTSGTSTVIAERYDTRNELGKLITEDDLYIMLLTFPLSGFLIWVIIGRGLDSLDRVAKEVSNRDPNYLESVKIESVPQEIKPVIDELNQLFHRLKEGFDREKRFAADAAHELRTPLAAIKVQAQVALHAHSIDEKNDALKKLISSVNRSAHVVQQLLTLSKLVPDTSYQNEPININLSKITQEIVATLAPNAIEKNIDLEFIEDKHLPKLKGNATAISILVRNLVDNAIRYTDAGGQVVIRVYALTNDIILEVVDNGPGIPDELRARVFERFFRVIGSKSQGSGLGLGIVQQIAELHHARVTLEAPKTGTGLVVKIYFPYQ